MKDALISESLASTEGRSRFWNSLGEDCSKSSMISLLETTLGLDGDVIECGVFRGRSLRLICKTCRDRVGYGKAILGLDTFEGFPENGISSYDTKRFRSAFRLMGKFQAAEDVPSHLRMFADKFDINLELYKGTFEEILPKLDHRRFCFIHLDCDTYRAHMECLASLYDRLVPGGIIVYDDYKAKAWPGAQLAIDEFLSDKPEEVEICAARERSAYFTEKII